MQLDDTLIAIADPTRRAILQQLVKGPSRVTDLARPFRISLNSVSKHIRILERARLVKRHVSGREHVLSFDPAPLAQAEEWIAAHLLFWTSQLDDLEARLRSDDNTTRTTQK